MPWGRFDFVVVVVLCNYCVTNWLPQTSHIPSGKTLEFQINCEQISYSIPFVFVDLIAFYGLLIPRFFSMFRDFLFVHKSV